MAMRADATTTLRSTSLRSSSVLHSRAAASVLRSTTKDAKDESVRSTSVPAGDLNGDCEVDLIDLQSLAQQMLILPAGISVTVSLTGSQPARYCRQVASSTPGSPLGDAFRRKPLIIDN